jgi:hypothetical protein
VRLLNYKRSGKPFWNMFTLAPMKDSDGTVRFFIGVQVGGRGERARGGGGWNGAPWPGRRPLAGAGGAVQVRGSPLGPCQRVQGLRGRATTAASAPRHGRTRGPPLPPRRAAPQVDVSASTAATGAADKLPAWTATSTDESALTARGEAAANVITDALQGMGLSGNPWAKLGASIMRRKPHKGADGAYQALLAAQVPGPLGPGRGDGAGARRRGRGRGRARRRGRGGLGRGALESPGEHPGGRHARMLGRACRARLQAKQVGHPYLPKPLLAPQNAHRPRPCLTPSPRTATASCACPTFGA